MEAWVRRRLPSRRIAADAFIAWEWLDEIDPLLELEPGEKHPSDGADDVARSVLDVVA